MTKPSSSVSVESLEAAVSSEIQEAGFSFEAAQAIAELSVCALCSVLGGSQVYFPHQLLNQYRDRRIYQLANGRNTAELAREFGLTERHVARIVHNGRKAKGRL